MYWGMSANSPPPLPNPFYIINALRYTRACTFKTIYVSASSPPPPARAIRANRANRAKIS